MLGEKQCASPGLALAALHQQGLSFSCQVLPFTNPPAPPHPNYIRRCPTTCSWRGARCWLAPTSRDELALIAEAAPAPDRRAAAAAAGHPGAVQPATASQAGHIGDALDAAAAPTCVWVGLDPEASFFLPVRTALVPRFAAETWAGIDSRHARLLLHYNTLTLGRL